MVAHSDIHHAIKTGFGLFMMLIGSMCCKAEILAEGDKIAELTIKSGRVYQRVTVRSVLPNGLKNFSFKKFPFDRNYYDP